MARVDASFVSWACRSLIASIVLTAAACGVSEGGAPREDVAGPTLATPSAAPTRTAQADDTPAPRPPDGQRAAAFEAVPPTPTGATEQADDRQPAATPAPAPTGATEQADDRPPAATPATAPTGATEQANDRPPAATPAPAPTGATEQANDPPPAATPATPPPTAGDDLTASPRRPSSQLRQLPDEESESPSGWESLDDVSRSAQGAEYTWQDGRHTRRAQRADRSRGAGRGGDQIRRHRGEGWRRGACRPETAATRRSRPARLPQRVGGDPHTSRGRPARARRQLGSGPSRPVLS